MLIGQIAVTGLMKMHTGYKNIIRNDHKWSMCGLVLYEIQLLLDILFMKIWIWICFKIPLISDLTQRFPDILIANDLASGFNKMAYRHPSLQLWSIF